MSKRKSPYLDFIAEFLAGWVSGCSGILVSHPFDTVKVRLQSQGVCPNSTVHYRGTIHCFMEIIRKEKIYGLFKGMTPPLVGTAAWNAVVFGTYGNTLRFLSENASTASHDLRHITIAGVATALTQSIVICPFELLKSRLQIQADSHTALYKGPVDCLIKTYRAEGISGVFRGMSGCIIRDIPGFVSYFLSYELLCRLICHAKVTVNGSEEIGHNHLGPFALMCAGGLAGTISWTLVFPPDVIKTRIQIAPPGKYHGFLHCLRTSFKEEGWVLFRRGLAPTVIRAFPMNAAIFSVYTLLMREYLYDDAALEMASSGL